MNLVEDYHWAADWFGGSNVLVTGGTSGIGASVTRAFLLAGARVTATGLVQTELDRLSSDSAFASAELKILDIRDGRAVNELIAALPALDILINCAGTIRRGEELDPAIFEQVVDVNLNGTMRCCAAARPRLAGSANAVIVNLASMLSFFGGGLVPGYAASKGGVSQLTKSLAIAYAPDAIRVNAVAPGWIATPLTRTLRDDTDRSAAILARTPLGRWGSPADIASAVLYLCSPAAAFITGTTLVVDGGYSIR